MSTDRRAVNAPAAFWDAAQVSSRYVRSNRPFCTDQQSHPTTEDVRCRTVVSGDRSEGRSCCRTSRELWSSSAAPASINYEFSGEATCEIVGIWSVALWPVDQCQQLGNWRLVDQVCVARRPDSCRADRGFRTQLIYARQDRTVTGRRDVSARSRRRPVGEPSRARRERGVGQKLMLIFNNLRPSGRSRAMPPYVDHAARAWSERGPRLSAVRLRRVDARGLVRGIDLDGDRRGARGGSESSSDEDYRRAHDDGSRDG